jgi:iron complex outermembrane receptor protein
MLSKERWTALAWWEIAMAVFFSAVIASTAWAESDSPEAETTNSEIDAEHDRERHHHHGDYEEIIVSGSATNRARFDLLQGSSILTGEELQRRIEPTIGETLAYEPGVSSTFFGRAASRPVIRGLGGSRVRTMVDGIVSFDASSESPDHAVAAEPLTLHRVEVIRGPATLLYGSSAVGGVVNMITERIPRSVPDRGYDFDAMAYWGSNADDRAGRGSIDLGTGSFAFHADGFARAADDYEIPGHAESKQLRTLEAASGGAHESSSGKVQNSDLDSHGASVGASYLAETWSLGASGTFFDTNYGIPGGHAHEAGEGEAHGDARIDLEQVRVDVRAELNRDLLIFDQSELTWSWGDYEHKELEGGVVGTRFENDGWEGRLEFGQRSWKVVDGAMGLQVTRNTFDAIGEEAFVPRSTTYNVGIFAVEELDLGDWGCEGWLLEIGGRYEHQGIDARGVSNYSGDTFSTSGGVRWAFAEGWHVGLLGYRNQRHPVATELYSYGPHIAIGAFQIGDAGLDAETALGTEFSIRRQGDRIAFGVNVYYTAYDDFIFLEPTGAEMDGLPVFRYGQRDAEFYGIEGELHLTLWEQSGYSLGVRTVVDAVRGRFRSGGNIPRMPPVTVKTGLELQSQLFNFGIDVRWSAEQNEIAAFELPTDSYLLLNFDLDVRPFKDHPEISLYARARNLTDEQARISTSFLKDVAPLPGRDFRLGAQVAF